MLPDTSVLMVVPLGTGIDIACSAIDIGFPLIITSNPRPCPASTNTIPSNGVVIWGLLYDVPKTIALLKSNNAGFV